MSAMLTVEALDVAYGDFQVLWQAELRCLRYRPERRYVAELRAADGTRALLKAYTERAYRRGE